MGFTSFQKAGGAAGVNHFQLQRLSGSIAMSGTAGKVALFKVQSRAATGAKPEEALDFVGFGTATCL